MLSNNFSKIPFVGRQLRSSFQNLLNSRMQAGSPEVATRVPAELRLEDLPFGLPGADVMFVYHDRLHAGTPIGILGFSDLKQRKHSSCSREDHYILQQTPFTGTHSNNRFFCILPTAHTFFAFVVLKVAMRTGKWQEGESL